MRMRRFLIGCHTSRSNFTRKLVRARIRSVVDPKTDEKRFTAAQVDNWQDMDVLTVLDVLIEPNAAALVDGNSLVLENIELVPSKLFVSCYYESLEHQLSTIYRQFMLLYEERRHDESTPQVRALERALKRSSEGQRLDKLNAAEGLASETEALLRSKARKYIDAAYGKLSAPVFCTKRKHQAASSYTQKCPGCGSFDHVYQECIYRLNPYFNTDHSVEFAQSSSGVRYYNKYGGRYIRERGEYATKTDSPGGTFCAFK